MSQKTVYNYTTGGLVDPLLAQQFYEARYQDGYMDEWPIQKKQRVMNLIREIDLPETGIALDFGCGNGVFTDVLKQALPRWEIYGSDISETALGNASKRFPELNFRLFDELVAQGCKFDLVFSHHVLEHVSDLEQIIRAIDGVTAPSGRSFHILPCGNKGSFEHDLASVARGGIDPSIGNRFYFEDHGHLRRLTTDQLSDAFSKQGFSLMNEWYANQYWGALEWMSDYPDEFIHETLAPDTLGSDRISTGKIAAIRNRILRIKKGRQMLKDGFRHQLKMILLGLKNNVGKIFSLPQDLWRLRITWKQALAFRDGLASEWQLQNKNRKGSEMYLVFGKNS